MPPEASAVAKRLRLPIGIQIFREISEEGHYYVDKTGLALDSATPTTMWTRCLRPSCLG